MYNKAQAFGALLTLTGLIGYLGNESLHKFSLLLGIVFIVISEITKPQTVQTHSLFNSEEELQNLENKYRDSDNLEAINKIQNAKNIFNKLKHL